MTTKFRSFDFVGFQDLISRVAFPTSSTEHHHNFTKLSHAIEYFALVGVMVSNKAKSRPDDAPMLTRAAKHVVLHLLVFNLYINVVFYGIKLVSLLAFQVIAYGASFTHYIYDGMIWRIRRPNVASDVGVAKAA